jgi:hypothetical protein
MRDAMTTAVEVQLLIMGATNSLNLSSHVY